uniref:Xaa-Pro dipeptidyl-peptidase-like domain-containing protein n=1 Tax=Phenylobacterium glaciei TaxID=2803784 RepID=A0A974P5G2_9CAUL|nr:hypothetical protein JKL49_07835 [Phenylobacterium glaciei]
MSLSRRGVLAAGVAAPSLYGLGAFAASAWSLPPVRKVIETEHVWIPMADGVRLSARLFVPAGAEGEPAPAVLEYIPYRKRDGYRSHDTAWGANWPATGSAMCGSTCAARATPRA